VKIYAISGLGADERAFQFLKLNCDFIPIDWIELNKNETILSYTARLSQIINKDEEFGILGVSFGGLIAVEISKILNPRFTILISSSETKNELGLLYKFVGRLKILKKMPLWMFKPNKRVVHYLFGSKQNKLLDEILDDMDTKFTKWAFIELASWQNETKIPNILKICGTKDKLMKPSKSQNTIFINGGEHLMIVDRADEISSIINDYLGASL